MLPATNSESSAHIIRRLLSVGADDLSDALQSAIEHAARTAGVEHSMLALSTHDRIEILATSKSNREQYELRVAAALGDPSRHKDTEHLTFSAKGFARGGVVCVPVVGDLPDTARAARESFQRHGVQSFLAIPIRSAAGIIGAQVFESVSEPRDWTEEEIANLRDITDMIGIAVDRCAAELALLESEARCRNNGSHPPAARGFADEDVHRTKHPGANARQWLCAPGGG